MTQVPHVPLGLMLNELLNAKSIAESFIDPSVERVSGLTLQGWHETQTGLLPVFKVRIPTMHLEDLYDLYIDGSNGRLIRAQKVALFSDGGVEDADDSDAGNDETNTGMADAGTARP